MMTVTTSDPNFAPAGAVPPAQRGPLGSAELVEMITELRRELADEQRYSRTLIDMIRDQEGTIVDARRVSAAQQELLDGYRQREAAHHRVLDGLQQRVVALEEQLRGLGVRP